MPPKKKSAGGTTGRQSVVRVKTAHKRTHSSTQWLARQLNDPYVREAKLQGYRSRAAFKLIQLDEQYRFLKPGMTVIDLGAAPGGWSQVARKTIGRKGTVLALDILPMEPLDGVSFLHCDFHDESAPQQILSFLDNRKADCVLSDMAPPTTGHPATDHLRILDLCDMAFTLATDILAPDGTFVCKTRQGGTEQELLARIKQQFRRVIHAKPAASRADSAEMYLVAMQFKGTP